MKILFFIFIPFLLTGQSIDSLTIFPIKLSLNNNELVCFKKGQIGQIYYDYQNFENCTKTLALRDLILASITRENAKLDSVIINDNTILLGQNKKIESLMNIISEKDKQLKLKDREMIVSEIRSGKTNWSLEIGIFLLGGLIGYAVGK